MNALQMFGVVTAAMAGGAALLMLLVGWLVASFGDDRGPGCTGMGLGLLVIATFIAIVVIAG